MDPSGFKTGQVQTRESLKKTKDETAQFAKQMQSEGKRAAEFFDSVKVSALSLIGVLIGGKGLQAFAKDATTSLSDLGRAAKNIGMSVPELAAFQNAIERNGGSAESATASFKGYADAIEEFRLQGSASPAFGVINALGIDPNAGPMAAFMKFMQFVQDNKDKANGGALINAFGHRLGFDQGLINAAEQMGTVAKAQAELGRSYELGVPSPAQVKAVTDMQNALVGLGQSAEYAGEHLLADLAPDIKAVSDAMSHWISSNPNEAEFVAGLTTALTALGAVRLLAILPPLRGIAEVMDRLVLTIPRLAPWLLPLALSGDTPNDPDLNKPASSGFWSEGGGFQTDVTHWWANHVLSHLGSIPSDVEARIRQQASLRGLDPDHMVNLARAEGGGYSNTSSAGAYGPMQLMPGTYGQYGGGPNDPWQKNVDGGLNYYLSLLRLFNGNYAAADAAYNAGPNNPGVKRFAATGDPSGLPAETQKYVRSINGVPKPSDPAANPNIPPVAPPVSPWQPPAPSGTPKPMQIGSITINTQATDAQGIARDMHLALVTQANRGLA